MVTYLTHTIGIRRMFNGYTQIIDAQDPKLIQNYPYNINRCSSPYHHYPCQDDSNPSLFKRIVGFFKGGIASLSLISFALYFSCYLFN